MWFCVRGPGGGLGGLVGPDLGAYEDIRRSLEGPQKDLIRTLYIRSSEGPYMDLIRSLSGPHSFPGVTITMTTTCITTTEISRGNGDKHLSRCLLLLVHRLCGV